MSGNYIDDLEVLEITRDVCKTEFPGYDKVNVSWEELSGLIDTDAWKTALANQKGVYLITDSSNGKSMLDQLPEKTCFGEEGKST